ncbi:MAG: alpha-amylase family glycosyl hydrolase [Spirochaetota bacterium]
MHTYPAWLDRAVFYQVYPPSFSDTDGDGIGDLPGITGRLDHVQSLGCNALWINPVFASPFQDGGYDITDYYQVAPRYGTLDDLKRLIREAHRRGIRVCLDMVPGHTSVQHPWFKASCSHRKNRFTNWYLWTGSVWDRDAGGLATVNGYAERDGNYVTNFFHCQPALNYGFARIDRPWQLPVDHADVLAVREEMKRIIRFYLDLGADGLRVDMAFSLVKNDPGSEKTCAYWREVRDLLDREYPDAAFIAEWGMPPLAAAGGFHADFLLHFHSRGYTSLFRKEHPWHVDVGQPGPSFFNRKGRGDMREFLDEFMEFRRALGCGGADPGTPINPGGDSNGRSGGSPGGDYPGARPRALMAMATGNHDMFRISRDRTPRELEQVFAFIMTMPVVPCVYYGDEIGMRYLHGLPSREGGYNRTGSRTPMQWDDSPAAGFSSRLPGELYLPLDPDPLRPSVHRQEQDSSSLLHQVRRLVSLRRRHPALGAGGAFTPLYAEAGRYPLVYLRSGGGGHVLVCVNPADRPERAALDLQAAAPGTGGRALQQTLRRLAPLAGDGVGIEWGNPPVVRAGPVSYGVFG